MFAGVYNTFIVANFNYCPIVWHFCGTGSTRKIEKIQERAFRFLYNDMTSSYQLLLENHEEKTLHCRRLKALSCEVFKTMNDLNPCFMKEFFNAKESTYDFRDEKYINFTQIQYNTLWKEYIYILWCSCMESATK